MAKKLTAGDVVEFQCDSIIDNILKKDISNKEKIKELMSSKAELQGSRDFKIEDREKFDKAIKCLEDPVKPQSKPKPGLLKKYLDSPDLTAAKIAHGIKGGSKKRKRTRKRRKKRTKKRTKKKRKSKSRRKRKTRRRNGGHHSLFW